MRDAADRLVALGLDKLGEPPSEQHREQCCFPSETNSRGGVCISEVRIARGCERGGGRPVQLVSCVRPNCRVATGHVSVDMDGGWYNFNHAAVKPGFKGPWDMRATADYLHSKNLKMGM